LQQSQHNFALGERGELRAVRFLISHALEIIDRNVSSRFSEIDLIAYDPTTSELVFVEVKTRSTAQFGHPATVVDRRKIVRLHKTAKLWMRQNREHLKTSAYRFDTIAVLPDHIEHNTNITWLW
jgi:putative endonuclease